MSEKLMKGITCCGDCGYYNWKKHKCSRATDEGEAQDHFYKDCPLPDVVAERTGRWEGYVCSECGVSSEYGSEPYCPTCGAKMDGEV